jgi:GNAT superfamily N-acetyltransferase
MMNTITQDLSAASLAQAIEDNLYAFLGTARHWPRAEVHGNPDLAWNITGYAMDIFNSLYRTRLTEETTDAAIEAAIARGRRRGVSLLWWTGPASTPADIGARLERHGFHCSDWEAGMAVDLLALPDGHNPDQGRHTGLPVQGSGSGGLEIEMVQDLGTLKTWCQTFVTGFDFQADSDSIFLDWFTCLSPSSTGASLHHYLGRLNGEAVATSSVFYAAGVAGLYNVATLPHARRRGIGAAITLAPLLAARAAGYRAAILQATEMGSSVYRKLGFQKYCDIGIYDWRNA